MSESSLPVLKHLMTHGNTTTFEWRTGKTPSQVEEQGIKIDLSDELDVGAEGETFDSLYFLLYITISLLVTSKFENLFAY